MDEFEDEEIILPKMNDNIMNILLAPMQAALTNVSSNHSLQFQSQSLKNYQLPSLPSHIVAFSNPVAPHANALLQPSQVQQQPQQQQLQQQQIQSAVQPEIPIMRFDPQSNQQAGVSSSEQIQDFFHSINRTTDIKNTQRIPQKLSAGR